MVPAIACTFYTQKLLLGLPVVLYSHTLLCDNCLAESWVPLPMHRMHLLGARRVVSVSLAGLVPALILGMVLEPTADCLHGLAATHNPHTCALLVAECGLA